MLKNRRSIFTLSVTVLFAATMLMCACSENDDITSEESSTVTSEVATAEATTEPATEPLTEPKRTYEECRMSAACTQLTCLNERLSDIYTLYTTTPMGGGIVAVKAGNVDDDNDNLVLIVDVIEDKILAEKAFQYPIASYGCNSKGLVLKQLNSKKFVFYNDMLEEIDEFDFRYSDGLFSEDGKSYFFIMDELLYKADVENGNIVKVSSSDKVRLSQNIQQDSLRSGKIIVQVKCPHNGLDCVGSLIDAESGEILSLNWKVGGATVGRCGTLMQSWYSILDKNSIYFLKDDGVCYCYDAPIENCICMIENSDEIYFIDDTGFCIGGFNENGMLSFSRIDEFGGIDKITGLSDENLIFAAVLSGDQTLYYVVDPELLESFDEISCETVDDVMIFDEELCDIAYNFSPEIPTAAEYLSVERERADKLEEEYGIKIYMSNQCAAFLDENGMDLDKKCTLTNEQYDEELEKEFINSTLDGLENALQKYPEGFFRQFRNLIGTEGVEIRLVGTITDDIIGAAAYAHNEGDDRFLITMDICQDNELNFPHEMWHCTESFIYNYDPELLSDEIWKNFNPDDFEYLSYWEYGNISYDFTYEDTENNGDWYFYDTYAKTHSFEDRARIMERTMTDSEYDRGFFESEHIQDKIRCMCDAVRTVFDTTGWHDVIWEQPLK